MATSLTTTINCSVRCAYSSTFDLSTPEDVLLVTLADNLASGTGTDQADIVWHDRRSLVGTSENLDLAGSLTDVFGNTLTFARVKGMIIKNRATTAGFTLSVGGAATNTFATWVGDATDILKIQPDGFNILWAPGATAYAVTAGTGDQLKIDSGANTISYDIILIGASA